MKERLPESRYDIKLLEDRAYIALCRDCSECENIELEPFALARLFSLYEKEGKGLYRRRIQAYKGIAKSPR